MSNSAGSQSLASYKAVSFDIFGTILDWEAGFYPYLEPIVRQLPESHPMAAPFPAKATGDLHLAPKHPLFVAFDRHEAKLMAELPVGRYETILAFAMRDLATELGVRVTDNETQAAGESQATWPAFADTRDALRRMQARGLKLVPLSNVSHSAVKRVLDGPFRDINFDAVYTAQDIGSYKPAIDNFEYLLAGVKKEFGVEREQLLHVAHGVASDQQPAEDMGIDHVWVERSSDNWGGIKQASMKRLRIVSDVKQLADEIDKAYDN